MGANTNKALTAYYARLINKGTYTIEQVPEDLRSEVAKLVSEMAPHEVDPVTETPELKAEDQEVDIENQTGVTE